jgi:protein-tyrosine phosphatase
MNGLFDMVAIIGCVLIHCLAQALYYQKEKQRIKQMESIHNFRDFGGYKTQNGARLKKGLLYRSGDLSKANDADLEQLSSLGIKTICDLRSERERRMEPDRIPVAGAFTFVHIPMRPIIEYHGRSVRRLLSLMFGRERRMDYVAESHKAYREYATSCLPQLKALFHHIANPENLPVLIHCSAGKDRTGVVSGLIQLVLGVSVETAMDDYLKTNDNLGKYTEEISRKISKLSYFGVPWKMFTPLFDARADFLNAAFAQVNEEFGAIDGWFRRGLGFSKSEQAALLAIFNDAPK